MSAEDPSKHTPFLSVNEAANYLRVSTPTIYGWVHLRKIPFRKHGNRLAFLRDELNAWSDSHKVSPVQFPSSYLMISGDKKSRSASKSHGSLKTKHTKHVESSKFGDENG